MRRDEVGPREGRENKRNETRLKENRRVNRRDMTRRD